MNKTSAAFFDRDGTIIVDKGYLHNPAGIEFIEGIPELIKTYNDAGVPVIVVSNQSGIARGMFTLDELNVFNEALNSLLKTRYGAHIDAFYCCPHLPEITGPCTCRKPLPGLFVKAIEDFQIIPEQSICYGDSPRDEEAARAAGVGQYIDVKAMR